MLEKGSEFHTGPVEQQSFEELKQPLTVEPVLHIYSREFPTELRTDASKDGFRAVLLHLIDYRLHPVFFWGKKTIQAS